MAINPAKLVLDVLHRAKLYIPTTILFARLATQLTLIGSAVKETTDQIESKKSPVIV